VNLSYHPKIHSEDLPEINPRTQQVILTAIETRLVKGDPLHGKPLRHSYFGLRRLRVGDYRIVYKISEKESIYVLMIKHRGSVYEALAKRIR